jgi:hypothetical protein
VETGAKEMCGLRGARTSHGRCGASRATEGPRSPPNVRSRVATWATRWRGAPSGDPGIGTRPVDDFPGPGTDLAAVPRIDVLDASASHEAAALALARSDPSDDLRALALARDGAPTGDDRTLRGRVVLEGSSPSGSSTNVPVEETCAVPFAVIATRFVALGRAVATDVRSTIPVASAKRMCQRLMSFSLIRSESTGRSS